MLHPTHHRNRFAGGIRFHNQANPIRQHHVRRCSRRRRHLQPRQRSCRPRWKHHRLRRCLRQLFRPTKPLRRNRLPTRHRLQRGRNRIGFCQILFCHAIDVRQRHLLQRLHILVRRHPSLRCQRIRPHLRQPRNRVPLKLCPCYFTFLRRNDQIFGQTFRRIVRQNRAHLCDRFGRIRLHRQRHNPIPHARLRIRLRHPESGFQSLPRRHHRVQISALASQHVRQNLRGRIVRRRRPRQPIRNKSQHIRQIAVERKRLLLQRSQRDWGASGQGMVLDPAKQFLHLHHRGRRIHIANDHQDRVPRRVPLLIKV